METAQKIQNLEAQKNQLISQAIIQENALQGTRQQVAQVEGQLIELRLIQTELPQKKDDKPKKTKADKAH